MSQSQYKWAIPQTSRTVEFFHRRASEIVQERLVSSGKSWEEAVGDQELELTKDDFASIEREFLESGALFEPSAGISVQEAPEKYQPLGDLGAVVELTTDEQGRGLAGDGDNVFSTPQDVVGIARFISSVDRVMEMLVDGVPEETVAIIDDSGGTLTAPILEEFKAVVCKGGSVRSHLGILTREYQIPCLMNVKVEGLQEGDRVQVEYSSPAKSPYDETDKHRARIWKLQA